MKNSLVIPYQPLPADLLNVDGRCHVTMFTAGITTMLTWFIQHENSTNPHNHLTESEWLERFTKFVENRSKKSKKDSKR
jgi:hypothetical protein